MERTILGREKLARKSPSRNQPPETIIHIGLKVQVLASKVFLTLTVYYAIFLAIGTWLGYWPQ